MNSSSTPDQFAGSIAIVGMACIFPGSPDLATYWRNISEGIDCISEVPSNRWDPVYYDPDSKAPDRLYCKRGGFIDAYAEFDAVAFGIMPIQVQGAEPDQLLALRVASEALADAGYDRKGFAREKTGVIVGRGNYMAAGMGRISQFIRTADQLAAYLRVIAPGVSEEEVEHVRTSYQSQFGPFGPDTAIGLVPNLTASRVANRLDLLGPAYTLDAACASSLLAVDQACAQLRSHACDMVLAGGIHVCHDVGFWSVFCQLGALSRTGQIRPFDRHADGLLIGEGVGFVVLKRLEDAERDDDRIYAVIRGVGVASDGRAASLMNPRVEGQVMALRRAWDAAGIPPGSVGLIEAHGTATPVGDAAELQTLTEFFGPPVRGEHAPVIGTVKSMIGHAMPAAGAAGLIKSALAVYNGTLPPTLHCADPHPALAQTRFRTIRRAEPWEKNGAARRAGVNAFGFGGINVHVVLEEHADRLERRQSGFAVPAQTVEENVLLLTADSPEDLLRLLDSPDTTNLNGPCRLAIFNPSPERLLRAREIVSRKQAWRGHNDFWFSPQGLIAEGGRLAVLFPGIDAAFAPQVEDLAARFKSEHPALAEATSLERAGLTVIATNRLLFKAVLEIGAKPDAIAGHSIGEWSGIIAGGMISDAEAEAFIGGLMPGDLEVPDVVFAAAGCAASQVGEAIRDLDGICVSHDNCPHQVIFCGKHDSVQTAMARLQRAGVVSHQLPYRSGFHSPHLRAYIGPIRDKLNALDFRAGSVPLWSATTCSPYPSDPDQVKHLIVEHLLRPVRFRELIEKMYADNFRVFIQAGSGSLIGFAKDILRSQPHLAMSANVSQRPGLAQLRRVAAALFVEGVDDAAAGCERLMEKRGRPMRLELGLPKNKLPEAPVLQRRTKDSLPLELREYQSNLDEVVAAQNAVLEAWERPRLNTQVSRSLRAVRKMELSVTAYPAFLDHCFYRQSPNCTSLIERYPIVPMTTSIEFMMDAARALLPHSTVVGIEKVRSSRWLPVAEPLEVEITAAFDGTDRVAVAIGDYVESIVRVSTAFPPAPSAAFPRLRHERQPSINAAQFYRDRWMFHGPAYQGVIALNKIGADGISGTIRTLAEKGGTLDNAGQLFGYWVMVNTEVDRLAAPAGVDSIEFFGPEPPTGEDIFCDVRVREFGSSTVFADMELTWRGKLWARVTGWQDRRLESNDRVWLAYREPERRLFSLIRPEGYSFFHDFYRTARSREYLSRRYLAEAERADYAGAGAAGPRKQRLWLAGRIAGKDAVRSWLWAHGHGPIFPAEIVISEGTDGRLLVRGPHTEDLRLSIATLDEFAVGLAALGRNVAIDIQKIDGGIKSPENSRREDEHIVSWIYE